MGRNVCVYLCAVAHLKELCPVAIVAVSSRHMSKDATDCLYYFSFQGPTQQSIGVHTSRAGSAQDVSKIVRQIRDLRR